MDTEERTFGRYRLTNLVGRGGMGQVFRAYDTETDRIVALKVLAPHMAQDDGYKQRFRREALAAARLNDPHIVPIHSFGEIDGHLYVDMRLIDGGDLGAMLREERDGLEQNRAVRIIYQVALALHAAHQAGLVHRDVKPSNILIAANDFTYLIDFGIVRTTEEASLTMTGQTLGTVAYMAPEQFGAGGVDARTDVYSLTCVLFQCLTGRAPFVGDTRQIVGAHVAAPPPRPSSVNPRVTPELDAVVARGMAKDPNERYRTASEFAEAMRAALSRPPAPAAAPSQPARPPAPVAAPPQYAPPPPYGPPAQLAGPAQFAGPAQQPGYGYRPPPAPRRPWWRRPPALVGAAAVVVAAVVAVVVLVLTSSTGGGGPTPTATAPTASFPMPKGKQDTLPFPSLAAFSVAVDDRGTVYVPDMFDVLSLKAQSATPETVELSQGWAPNVITTGPTGTLYLIDLSSKRIASLAQGASTPKPLPFGPLAEPSGLAVDSEGALYVTDTTGDKVLKLDAGGSDPVEVPFADLDQPKHIAVASDGTVYVSASGGLVKLEKGSTTEEPVAGAPTDLGGITVDEAGNLYATDSTAMKVVVLPKGASEWVDLPFSGLKLPTGIAVDPKGNVFVLDEIQRIVELPAE